MKFSLSPGLLSIFLLLSISGCLEAPAAPQSRLVITGSSTIAPLVAEIGKRFETFHPQWRVDVQTGGSSRGISDTRQNLADIGMASRSLKDEEHDLHGTVIAYDGIGFIVHRSNPIVALQPQDIIDIYTGQTSNWNKLGGMDAPITVVNKAEGRATLELFLKFFQLKSRQIKAHVVIGDNEQGVKTVAGNPNAIGYVSIGTAEYDAAHGIPIKLLRLGDIPASLKTVQEGLFPLSRPLNLVTTTVSNESVKAFIDFATSPEVHDLVKQHYFVPLSG